MLILFIRFLEKLKTEVCAFEILLNFHEDEISSIQVVSPVLATIQVSIQLLPRLLNPETHSTGHFHESLPHLLSSMDHFHRPIYCVVYIRFNLREGTILYFTLLTCIFILVQIDESF